MTILWSIVSAVITSFITTLVFNFFLQRMTENAKKPRMTRHHQGIIELLSSPNVVAQVQLPNGRDKNYEVVVMPCDYRMAGGPEDEQLGAFEEMVDQKIVVPVSESHYRLSHNHKDKYRKSAFALACEEFGLKSIFALFKRLSSSRKSSNSLRMRV